MPLTKLQMRVLALLASQRSLDSYVAGGIALNRDGPRFSKDIDLFQDSEDRLESAAEADFKVLAEAGVHVEWRRIQSGRREAILEADGERMRLDWVQDSAFRFFPAQRDELFGYVLHPVDLATNKAVAAADRREARDIVDLLTIHETILPLGAAICAAVGRFPGQSPEEMLADIIRHSRFTAEEFRTLALDDSTQIQGLAQRINHMLDDARDFIAKLPSAEVGFVFLEDGKPVQPSLEKLASYEKRSGSTGGVWPSSPEITRSMLESYRERKETG